MEAFRIEILNPKALQLIKGMQDLDLIKITKEPISKIRAIAKTKKAKEVVDSDSEEKLWRDYSAKKFLKAYGEDEPEYTDADIKEPNPEYKKWKGK